MDGDSPLWILPLSYLYRCASPAGGNGHYAGNIALTLGGDNCPVFTTTGFKVSTQWRDMDAHNIAPHLYYNSGVFQLTSAPVQAQNTVIDTWNSSDGPYGGANVGPLPTMQIGAPMPTVTAPTGLPNQGFKATTSLSGPPNSRWSCGPKALACCGSTFPHKC